MQHKKAYVSNLLKKYLSTVFPQFKMQYFVGQFYGPFFALQRANFMLRIEEMFQRIGQALQNICSTHFFAQSSYILT